MQEMGHQEKTRVTKNGWTTSIGGGNYGFYIFTNIMVRNKFVGDNRMKLKCRSPRGRGECQ
jgi:hypothetical protein